MLQAILDWVAICPELRTRDVPRMLSAVRVDELPVNITLASPTDVSLWGRPEGGGDGQRAAGTNPIYTSR